jgi:hypothetical protein
MAAIRAELEGDGLVSCGDQDKMNDGRRRTSVRKIHRALKFVRLRAGEIESDDFLAREERRLDFIDRVTNGGFGRSGGVRQQRADCFSRSGLVIGQ